VSNSDELAAAKSEPFRIAVSQFQDLFTNCGALTVLLGAGCSSCAGLPLTSELTDTVLACPDLDADSKSILVAVRAIFNQAADAHIEDYLSDIVDLLAITDRRAQRGVPSSTIPVGDSDYEPQQLRTASEQIKRAIARAVEEYTTIDQHRAFISAVHQHARVGRPDPSRPVDYIVLNYDTIVEDALAMQSIPYADGLSGGATAWWDPNSFDSDELSARVIKLHGSVDWYQVSDDPMPRRIRRGIAATNVDQMPLLIWPSSKKYQETQLNPFAQLLDRARSAMRSMHGEQRLLIVCGYSFGDKHVNIEIEKALRESQENLTLAAFTHHKEPAAPLDEWSSDPAIGKQILIYADGGFYHPGKSVTSATSLNWWRFENLASLLATDL